jgi:hypothetical protein
LERQRSWDTHPGFPQKDERGKQKEWQRQDEDQVLPWISLTIWLRPWQPPNSQGIQISSPWLERRSAYQESDR